MSKIVTTTEEAIRWAGQQAIAEERARIRRELLEAIETARFDPALFGVPLPTRRGALRTADVLAALDRICPEGKE